MSTDTVTKSTGRIHGIMLGAGTLTIGLMAGLYFGVAVAVMPGLAVTDDRTFVHAMQKINEAIQNGAFGATFFGAFLFTGTAALLQQRAGARAAARWVLAATLLYFVTLVITFGINIPLNNELAAAGDPDRIADIAAVRHAFEDNWIVPNATRAVLCTLALLCMARATALSRRGA